MKFFNDFYDWETVSTIIIALLFGMFLGVFFQTKYSLGIRTVLHNFYQKINPDSQKDSKTLIMERVTKDTPVLPQKDIFEQPKEKENKFMVIIKHIFVPKSYKKQTINDEIIY